MIRRPPRSTLFPYPTVSRPLLLGRAGAAHENALGALDDLPVLEGLLRRVRILARRGQFLRAIRGQPDRGRNWPRRARMRTRRRSEEHTSELQSLAYLVCRLL